LAAGVTVVQPRHAAFSELVEATGGGVLYEPPDTKSLADQIEKLLLNPAQAEAFGLAGREAVQARFTVAALAEQTMSVIADLRRGSRS
jgi:glycosyltransferase involved in cell wall biosynthesis